LFPTLPAECISGLCGTRAPYLPYALAPALFACQPFEYSPTILEAERREPHLNATNLERIAALFGPRLQGKIAILADTHLFYDELRDGVPKFHMGVAWNLGIVSPAGTDAVGPVLQHCF
jgi:hypothetical protein